MRIIIGADMVPTKSNCNYFCSGQMERIVEAELFRKLKKADYRVFNLELPLICQGNPIPKCGPNLKAPREVINGYLQLGVDMVTIANNHILDYGSQGLESTMNTLDEGKIAFSGAGMSRHEAIRPYIFEKDGLRVGFYCCAENEFSIATEKKPGANPFDPLESLDHIVELKKSVDFVICLYHGGKEYYRYPSPMLQTVCRKIAEKGADIVLCQHSHCIGCEENWKGSKIVYGQGNFLFDYSDKEHWQTGLLMDIELEKGKPVICRLIAIRKNGNGVRLADDTERTEIMQNFAERSREIQIEGFVQQRYKMLSNEILGILLGRFDVISSTFLFRTLNRICRGKVKSWYYSNVLLKKKRYQMINAIECEAWREAFLSGLKED